MDLIRNKVKKHYNKNWDQKCQSTIWKENNRVGIIDNLEILIFKPNSSRTMWTYATCGMSTMNEKNPLELHIFSKNEDNTLIELLTAIVYYHRGNHLDLNHTVNFGRPWQDNSICNYGFISLPYLDGPLLENLYIPEFDENIKFYWLIPISEKEVNHKIKFGSESLENKFDEFNFDYLDSKRVSII